jgi:Domain of unknown function (DUF1772)
MILTSLALAGAAAFAGAAAYVNLAEQPARLQLDDVSLLREWKPSYAKGLEMQATLALVSGLLGLATFFWGHHPAAALGGVLMLANWPYTLLVMAATNKTLAATADQDAGPATRARIVKWGKLHAVRTFLGLAGACAFVLADLTT